MRSSSRSSSACGTTLLTQAPVQRGTRIDELAGEQHLERPLARHVARYRHARRRAEQSEVDARGGETRVRGGDRQVARGDQLASGSRRGAVHSCDHRLRHRLHRQHHAAARLEQPADERLVAVAHHFLEIVATRKRRTASGDHHHAHFVIASDGFELGLQGHEHLHGDRVVLARAIERQPRDAAFDGAQDRLHDMGFGRIHGYSIAEVERARSRRRNFWILPVEVLGISPNTILRGDLKRARSERQCSIRSASDTFAPGFTST